MVPTGLCIHNNPSKLRLTVILSNTKMVTHLFRLIEVCFLRSLKIREIATITTKFYVSACGHEKIIGGIEST